MEDESQRTGERTQRDSRRRARASHSLCPFGFSSFFLSLNLRCGTLSAKAHTVFHSMYSLWVSWENNYVQGER